MTSQISLLIKSKLYFMDSRSVEIISLLTVRFWKMQCNKPPLNFVSTVRMGGVLYKVQGEKKTNFAAVAIISIHAYSKLWLFCPVLGSPVQQGHGTTGASSEKGYEENWRTEAPVVHAESRRAS